MRNILILLSLLVGPVAVAALWKSLTGAELLALENAGRLGLVLLFCFTGIGHFIQTGPMSQMLPPFVPARVAIVYVTGVLEILGGIGLLVPMTSRAAGICLLAFLILILPVNIYSAIQRVPMGGHASGPSYLLARVPLQLIFIGWTWWFGVR